MPELADVLTDDESEDVLVNDIDDFEPEVTEMDLVSPLSACAYAGNTGAV